MPETPDPVGTSLSNTKMLTFSTLGAVFTLKEVEFKKKNNSDFILINLVYSGFCTCLQTQNPSSIKEVRISPRK